MCVSALARVGGRWTRVSVRVLLQCLSVRARGASVVGSGWGSEVGAGIQGDVGCGDKMTRGVCVCGLRADEVHSLENRKFQLQKTMEQRSVEINANRDLLRADLKMAQEALHAVVCAPLFAVTSEFCSEVKA